MIMIIHLPILNLFCLRSIYAIFSGQGGSQVAEFSLQRIAAEILLGQLNEKGATEEDVKEVLRQAFVSAEKGYLDSIDSNLARKTVLQCELEGLSQYEVSCYIPVSKDCPEFNTTTET